ncbi:MAG: hypothetical protein IJ644_08935 [Oscillospiraceae bacterium]|nr:hypothetical protein [Oscillospiraceae bacterium]
MPDYDSYLMTIALLCNHEKPMTSPEIWKCLHYQHGIPISRDKVNHLLEVADSRYAMTCEKDDGKLLHTLKKDETVIRSVLLTRNLLTTMQTMHQQRKGSPELQNHLKTFFSKYPALLNKDSGIQPAEVYSICLLQKMLALLRDSPTFISIPKLTDRLNFRCLAGDELSPKRIRRIAEKELPRIFFAEVSGSNLHSVRLLPESLIKVFQHFTPADVLELYDFMHHAGITSLF